MASFGESLRRERELRGVTLHQIAEATKISARFLQALEQERYEVLPGGLFPRAFVRQYAQFLGLDADRLVAEFDGLYGQNVQTVVLTPPARQHGNYRSLLMGLGLAAGVVILFLNSRTPEGPVDDPFPVALPPPAMPEDRVYPPPQPLPSAPVPTTGGVVLELNAKQDCWTGIEADGAKVLDRILTAGETTRIEAKQQIVLSVGNAGGVTFMLNGYPGIVLGREGEVRRDISITRESMASLLVGGLPPQSMSPVASTPSTPTQPSPSPTVASPRPRRRPKPSPLTLPETDPASPPLTASSPDASAQ